MRGRRAGEGRPLPGDLREVGRHRHRHRRGHRRRPAGDRLARRADRRRRRRAPSPTRARSTSARTPARTGRTRSRPTTPNKLARPGDRRRSCASRSCSWSPRPNLASKSWVTDQYDRFVQGNTVLAQPEDAGMVRIDEETEPRRRPGHRRQRPLRQARPVHGRAAGAGGGVPQRRHDRRQAAGRLRLPELRLARGPGGHVAVRRGHARSRRRLPAAGHPGDRRQRLALQPDRRGRRSTRRRSSPCSA